MGISGSIGWSAFGLMASLAESMIEPTQVLMALLPAPSIDKKAVQYHTPAFRPPSYFC